MTTRPLTSKDLKERLKQSGSTVGVSKLTSAQALLQCAAKRLITEEEFSTFQQKAKGKGSGDVKVLQWPLQEDIGSSGNEERVVVKRSRPDVAIRRREASNHDFDVVTCTLRSFCKPEYYEALALVLEETLSKCNQVMFEAYELSNAHVLRMLEEDRGGGSLGELNQSFFYRCCNAVCVDDKGHRFRVEDTELDKTAAMFHRWRNSVETPPVLQTGMSRFFQQIAHQMETNSKNILLTTFYKRLKQYVQRVLDCSGKLAFRITLSLCGWSYLQPSNEFVILPGTFEARMNDRLKEAMGLQAGGKLTDTILNTRRAQMLGMMRTFQLYEDPSNGQSIKKFNLMPTKSGFTTSFIKIGTNSLRELLKASDMETNILKKLLADIRKRSGREQCKKGGDEKLPSEAVFLEEADLWWRKLFHVKKFETKARWFGCEIMTDGRSVKVTVRKPAKKVLHACIMVQGDDTIKLDLLLSPKAKESFEVTRPNRVVGLDPGFIHLFTAFCVQRGENGRFDVKHDVKDNVVRCSAREFYHGSKYNSSTRKIEEWTKKRSHDLGKILAEMPPRKYVELEGCECRVKYVLAHWNVLYAFYGARRFRNAKLTRYIHRRKMLKDLCLRIVGGSTKKNDTFVGFGDWGGANGLRIKGRCGPYKRLKTELKKHAWVFDVDEAYTSQVCSCCHKKKLVNLHRHLENGERCSVHAVLHCTNSECKRKTWDRDVNASRNIFEIFLATLNGLKRPEAFYPDEKPKAKRTAKSRKVVSAH